MSHREQCLPPADAAQLCREWSAHVDALDSHLSANKWAMAAFTLVAILYPAARIFFPIVLHKVVPDVVRTVLHLI